MAPRRKESPANVLQCDAVLKTIAAFVLVAGFACAAAPAAQQTPLIEPGVRVLGVPVGGLSSEPARAKISRSFRRPIEIRYGNDRLIVTPGRLGAGAGVDAAVTSALAATPRSQIALPISYSHDDIKSYVTSLAHKYDVAPVDAQLLGLTADASPSISEEKTGLAVQRATMERALTQELSTGARTPLELLTQPVAPKVTRATFGDVIVIVRGGNSLRLYDGETLVRSFGVATGRAQYPTPSGTFEIVDKQRNPWWYPPKTSEWAKGLEPVPPGPGNPLGTRWMGLSAPGVGIHGTPDDASIGYSASHGCIRMHVPDAEWLFDHVDWGTPVVII
jgi:lipoprotein-anchoring transpeptidase ErfK/SrfK